MVHSFGGSVVIWLLNYAGPSGFGVDMGDSYLAMIGGFIAPLFAPLGFGTWQAAASLLTGFLAKEVVVSTMAIIYAVKEDVLGNVMGAHYTALSAYAFMFFILLYVPCLATVAVIKRETGSVDDFLSRLSTRSCLCINAHYIPSWILTRILEGDVL